MRLVLNSGLGDATPERQERPDKRIPWDAVPGVLDCSVNGNAPFPCCAIRDSRGPDRNGRTNSRAVYPGLRAPADLRELAIPRATRICLLDAMPSWKLKSSAATARALVNGSMRLRAVTADTSGA